MQESRQNKVSKKKTKRRSLNMALQQWSKKVIKELAKHADRDNCYQCKQLLAELATAYSVKPEDLTKKHN
jgi:hypothetical protein